MPTPSNTVNIHYKCQTDHKMIYSPSGSPCCIPYLSEAKPYILITYIIQTIHCTIRFNKIPDTIHHFMFFHFLLKIAQHWLLLDYFPFLQTFLSLLFRDLLSLTYDKFFIFDIFMKIFLSIQNNEKQWLDYKFTSTNPNFLYPLQK